MRRSELAGLISGLLVSTWALHVGPDLFIGLIWLVLSVALWSVFVTWGMPGVLVVDGLALVVMVWLACRRGDKT